MISELVDGFDRKHGQRYQISACSTITDDDPRITPTRCPRIVHGVFSKVRSLLAENGSVRPSGSSTDLELVLRGRVVRCRETHCGS